MKQSLSILPFSLLFVLGTASPLAAQQQAPPRRVALTVLAYNRSDKDAAWPARSFTNGPRDLVKELIRHGWDAQHRRSESQPRLFPKWDEIPDAANIRRYLKSLAALRPDDEAIIVLVGHLASLEDGKLG